MTDMIHEGQRIVVVSAGIARTSFVATFNTLWPGPLQRPEIIVIDWESREESIMKNPHMLTLNGGSQDEGLIALEQLGLLYEIHPYATLNSDAIKVYDGNWKYLASINPEPHGNLPAAAMRIRREALKRVFLDKADPGGTFRFGCVRQSVERLSKGQLCVTISHRDSGLTENLSCDILIVADGPHITVRPCLCPSDMKLEYTGATQISGICHLPGGLPTPVEEDYVLQTSSGEDVCCIYTPFDAHTIGWALSKVEPLRKAKTGMEFPEDEFAALKREALETGLMFAKPFPTIVEATEPGTAFVRPAMERHAFFHQVPRLRGIVFIGDANHVLSPSE
ncbi:putative monooxygenase [Xylariomycetidae sp. FL2044]|nr:putative monooxygenase [Xylariomycetidae sp. FL2044]